MYQTLQSLRSRKSKNKVFLDQRERKKKKAGEKSTKFSPKLGIAVLCFWNAAFYLLDWFRFYFLGVGGVELGSRRGKYCQDRYTLKKKKSELPEHQNGIK